MKSLFLLLLILFSVGCNKSGGGAFENLEDEPVEANDPSINGPVTISSFTPIGSPVQIIAGLNTFAVQIAPGAGGNVTYNFRLDGVSVQDTTSSFYVLNGTGMIAGAHTLNVVASNPEYSASHTFNLYVNSPPVLNISSNTATTISCIGGTFTLNVTASDADGDPLVFSYFLNGATGNASMANSNPSSTTATTVFTPNCGQAGLSNIKIRATDSVGAFSEQTIAVTVSNPTMASITSYSPLANPVIINSSATQMFQISPDGSTPFTMAWTLTPGGVLAACNNSSTCNVDSNAGARVGSYTLNILLTDQNITTATRDFNIYFNAPPVFGVTTPSNAAPIKMKCSESQDFVINVTDQNGVGLPQTHSITWTYGGIPVSNPSVSGMFTESTNVATHPFTSTLTFNPNCNSAALQGVKEIEAVVTDGFETDSIAWDVSTSFFSSACLNLAPGQICTIAGLTGLGNNIDTTDASVRHKQVIVPRDIAPHHIDGGMFISDIYNDVIWFYNHRTSGSITVFGKTVAPKGLIALFGAGHPGLGIDGETFNSFYLSDPYGMEWDSANEILYIADSGNNRIVRFTTSGTVGAGYRFAAGGATGAPGNIDGSTRNAHTCRTPTDVKLVGNKLYASCYNNTTNNVDGSLKYFSTVLDEGYSVARFQSNIATGPCGTETAGCNFDGTINNYASSTARTRQIYSLGKHPTKDIIFAGDLQRCQVMAFNASGSSDSFMGITVPNNEMRKLTAAYACGAIPGAAISTASRLTPYGMSVKVTGTTLEGLYIANQTLHSVFFLNFTAGNITIGGKTIASNSHDRVIGTGLAEYARAKPAYQNSLLSSPRGVSEVTYSKVDPSDGFTKDYKALAISDITNGRIAYLETDKTYLGSTTAITNGDVGDMVGYQLPYGYDGEIDVPANEQRFYNPASMEFNPNTNELLVVDSLNYRIRAINLSTGQIRTKIGSGVTATTTGGDPRLSVPFRTPRDLAVIRNRNAVIYGEYQSGGALRSCYLRVLNEGLTTDTFFSVPIASNYVETVAGQYALGCAAWSAGYESGGALDASLNDPYGVYVDPDGDFAYFTNRNTHCILKVDSSGIISSQIGDCRLAGADVSGAFASARLNVPGDIERDPDAAFSGDGNFFFVDRSHATTSYIKYANFSATGVDFDGDTSPDVGSMQVAKFISVTDGYVTGVAAYDDPTLPSRSDWVCYSQGTGGNMATTAQNVICTTRDQLSTFRVGRASIPSVSPLHRGRRQLNEEQEGIAANQATLSSPYGLAFDSEGNLYIADYLSHSIKMVKKWW